MNDPISITRRRVRRVLMRALKRHWRRCFWSWPLGHDWPQPCWASTVPASVSRCRSCGKPAHSLGCPSILYFTERDLVDLAEETLSEDAALQVTVELEQIPDADRVA